jgi:hypothetical protein
MCTGVHVLIAVAFAGGVASLTPVNSARETTVAARKLTIERIDTIAAMASCRQTFVNERIDLNQVRATVRQLRFYDAQGPEGLLLFSEVVGFRASPDRSLRELAKGLAADAFILGYQNGTRYTRTKHVVLGEGYHWQQGDDGMRRATALREKQALLLHEALHVALDRNDDDLTQRELCPLRLLAFCQAPAEAGGGAE